jgi:hypothetical protein
MHEARDTLPSTGGPTPSHAGGEPHPGDVGSPDVFEGSEALSALRQRYAKAVTAVIRESPLDPLPQPVNSAFPVAWRAADAVLAVRDEELESARAAAQAELRGGLDCALLAVRWQQRAEQAEAGIARVRALHSRDDSNSLGPWCGTCTTSWPCQTIRALDDHEGLRR